MTTNETVTDERWAQVGMRCKVRLVVGPADTTPEGFETELIQEGQRVGAVPVTVQRFCPDGCHAEVRFDDHRFTPLTVDVEDLAPFGEC